MGRTPRLLLIDAIPDHVISYSRAFTEQGYGIDVATTADDGLAAARQQPPECIVIDVRLPDRSGWELCRELKEDSATRDIPVVVLTPDTSREHVLESARSLCTAWMAQPSQADDLVRAIQHVLAQPESAPRSPEEAVLGVAVCPACDSDRVRATLRVSPVQYYACHSCGHGWRVEAL
jgi:two-component system, chemotaxis family, response regulator PixH